MAHQKIYLEFGNERINFFTPNFLFVLNVVGAI
jgi:hypothetical protein